MADFLLVTEEVALDVGSSRYAAAPGPFSLSCHVDFPTPHIGAQSVLVDGDGLGSLACARTFVLERDIAALRSQGLALGGSLENAVVVGDTGVLNPDGFRMPDECVRHKALDLIGDLMVLGLPVIGRFEATAPGHAANNAFAEKLVASGGLVRVSGGEATRAAA